MTMWGNPRLQTLSRPPMWGNPRTRNRRISTETLTTPTRSSTELERGIEFETGDSFYRRESAISRDLGVLAATIQRKSKGCDMRILDAMCGCGVRSLRYLSQAGAGFVWANDANEEYRTVILSNLDRVSGTSLGEEKRWVVTHSDANRVLAESYLRREFFDMVDVDSFGSDSSFMKASFMAVRIGGLMYLTSTDGFSSGGHRPRNSLASYGAYIRPMPYSNEVGLRMLIGGALREAAALGFHVVPLFSYYSYHGPVFRVMLHVTQGKFLDDSCYGFISYCRQCGNSQAFSWGELGKMCCSCKNGEISRSLVVSGPLWIGPLHDAVYVSKMLETAREWGWASADNKEGINLDKLLKQMIDESDPKLPFGYIKLDEIASRGKVNSPPLSTMINYLQKEGYAASRSHIASNAIKTNCPMTTCIQIARELREC